jgi:hypothetical protein
MNDEQLPPRFLELPPDQLTPDQRAGLDVLLQGSGRIPTPYKVWLHSPGLLRAMEQLRTFLNKQSTSPSARSSWASASSRVTGERTISSARIPPAPSKPAFRPR